MTFAALCRAHRLGRIVAVLAGLALLAPTQAATAQVSARATAPAVKASHLPTFEEMTALYVGFDGGYRKTPASTGTFVIEGDCKSYTSGPNASKGRFADYYGAFGSQPVHDGYEYPSVYVMSFRTQAAAKKAYDAQKKWINNCDGKTTSGNGESKSFAKTKAPSLGDERIGYRLERIVEDDEPWHMNTLDFWIRDGRRLVNATVRQDVEDAVPSKATLVELTEITFDRLP